MKARRSRRSSFSSVRWLFALALALAACDRVEAPAGNYLDDLPADAGVLDAGGIDAGPPDSGPADAGPLDAGPPDSGPADAGPPDAGSPDAGPADAGPPDAGSPCDLGTTIRIVGLELPYLASGAERAIAVEVRDATNTVLPGLPVLAWSDDPSVAEATAGLVTGLSRGRTTISASCGLLATSAPIVILPPARILFVHDDGSDRTGSGMPDVSPVYLGDLSALGFAPDELAIAYNASLPGVASLTGYHLVVWACGMAYSSTLTTSDRTALTTYLDGGGRLFLSSQDYLYDRGTTGAFERSYLGVLDYDDDALRLSSDCPSVTLSGSPGDPIGDGLAFTLTLASRSGDCYFNGSPGNFRNAADVVDRNGLPAGTSSVLFSHALSGDPPAVVRTRTATYATLFASFPYEVIEDSLSRRIFMARAIDTLVDQ